MWKQTDVTSKEDPAGEGKKGNQHLLRTYHMLETVLATLHLNDI